MQLLTKTIALLGTVLCSVAAFGQISPSWTDYDRSQPSQSRQNRAAIARQIRFHTAAGADAKRQQLINWIWPGGLPATLPSATDVPLSEFPAGLQGKYQPINRSLVGGVVKLDANVSDMDFHSISYLLSPKSATANTNRLVIVHQGHFDSAQALDRGIGNCANVLLQRGYSVLLVQMPLSGWNTDNTVKLPGGQAVTISGITGAAHDDMFRKLAAKIGTGAVYRLFIEPVVQDINYFTHAVPNAGDVSMTGLSGGGWTATMAPTVDARIKLSIPVAGSAPFYCRLNDPRHVGEGDSEQYQAPLYNENVKPDGSGGGVCTYLEMYALGGYGQGRRQIMVTNLHDPSCFAGTFPDGFKNIVSEAVSNQFRAGSWEHIYDTAHISLHQMTDGTISNVILPALAVPEPPACVPAAAVLLECGECRWRMPQRRWARCK